MAARQFGAKREARKAVRRLVDLDCAVYCELWGESISHRVTDLSEEGLWIRTELLLEVGTEVTLTFHPPDWEQALCVAGRVQRVELRSRSADRSSIGMGIGFETLRNDERRRLTQSMRCLRAEEAFILDQRTLTGVPVGPSEPLGAGPARGRTLAGWSAPAPAGEPPTRPSRITAAPAERADAESAHTNDAFPGGLDLAASIFATDPD